MDGGQSRLRVRPGWRSFPLLHGLILVVWLVAASGCEGLPWPAASSALPSAAPPGVTPSLEVELTPPPTEGPVQTLGIPNVETRSSLLRLWLPPQFDPQAETPAARLLRLRLIQFANRHPEVHLEVRIKAESGPGGLLAALSAASVSAPLTLPDVVALPRPLLETAALKGVVFPMDGLPVAEVDGFLTEPDWYPYAVQMGRLQDNTFGLPFAGDLLVMASRTFPEAEATSQPTSTFEGEAGQTLAEAWFPLFAAGTTLAFPAADPQSLYTLLLYRSLGGQWVNGDGRPYLDTALLEQVLALYQQASQAEVLPYWLSQYETDEQVWEVFKNGEADHLVTWASRVLFAARQAEAPLALEPLPTLAGHPYTLATGWVWAVASPDPERRALAGELAAFLVESDFLARWNTAAGYLPPRFSALAEWEPAAWRALVSELSVAAELLPQGELLPVLGPPLRQATVDVLKLQAEPAAAAQIAASALNPP